VSQRTVEQILMNDAALLRVERDRLAAEAGQSREAVDRFCRWLRLHRDEVEAGAEIDAAETLAALYRLADRLGDDQ